MNRAMTGICSRCQAKAEGWVNICNRCASEAVAGIADDVVARLSSCARAGFKVHHVEVPPSFDWLDGGSLFGFPVVAGEKLQLWMTA